MPFLPSTLAVDLKFQYTRVSVSWPPEGSTHRGPDRCDCMHDIPDILHDRSGLPEHGAWGYTGSEVGYLHAVQYMYLALRGQ